MDSRPVVCLSNNGDTGKGRFVFAPGRMLEQMGQEAKAKQIAARDGWNCHYCGIKVGLWESEVVGWEYYPDPWNEGYGDHEPGWYPTYQSTLPEGEKPAQVEHKTPKCKGGTNHLDNLVLACQDCNYQKGSMDYEEFIDLKK